MKQILFNKTTSKAKRLIMAVALCILGISQALAYDFSAVSSSGHTLYYEIISGTTNVGVVSNTYNNYVSGNVVIPDTVSYNGATYNVTELKTVSTYGSFEYCSGLTSVTIPNSVTSIGMNAFNGCSGLTSVTIPNSVTTIGDYAFQDCSSLTSVTIPNSVTTIGIFAFSGCSSLTSVTIGNSVTTIGDYAFQDCTGLTSVTIGNSVTTIGEVAFCNCSGLTSVTIPNSVTSIGIGAFYYCTGLTSVTIPNSVTTIGNNAFYLVKNIIYNGSATGSPWGALNVNGYIDGDFIYSDSTKTILTAYIGTSSNVTIPNSVTTIGTKAFRVCTGLTSVTIPNSVTTIGTQAFIGCSSLTTLNFNAVNCSDFSSSFDGCPISTINIGDSVQRIPAYFAYNKSSLTSLTIPNSVTTIGTKAFYNCSGLTSVTIPNSVTTIENHAFSGCSSLTTLNFNAVNCSDFNSSYHPFSVCPISTITIGDSVQRIPRYFAYNKTSLTSITIPDLVTSIGNYAFWNCSGLTSVTIPNSVTTIGTKAFYNCSDLTTLNFNAINCNDFDYNNHPFTSCPISTINIGDSVQRIPGYFADDRTSLTSITIPNSVTSVGESAFNNCTSLTTLNFNAINCSDFSSTSSYHPFSGCPISTINIGDSVQRIPGYFAYNLESLTSVTIPSNVANIEDKAFNGRSSLHEVISLAVLPPSLGEEIFSATAILKVPCGSAAYYSAPAAKWADYFISIEEICDNITITVISANENMGTVSGSGEYLFGSEVTITATPKQGYRFVSWNDGNTENPRTIVVEAEATYIATFEEEIGIETASELDELRLYPNPTSGTITFNSTDIRKVEVMDAVGRIVAVYNDSYIIDLSKLSKGYYTLRVTTDRGVAIRKVIRN